MNKGSLIFVLSLLVACSNTKDTATNKLNELPKWVSAPKVEGEFAVTECVVYSGNLALSIVESQAVARQSMKQQLMALQSSIERAHIVSVDSEQDNKKALFNTPEYFMNKTSIFDRLIRRARFIKQEFVEIDNIKHVCVMLTLKEKTVYESIKNNTTKSSSFESI